MFETKFYWRKKLREGTALECAAMATGLGRAKACKWVVKEQRHCRLFDAEHNKFALLPETPEQLFYQGHRK